MRYTAYQPHNAEAYTLATSSQKYTNIHQIRTSGEKFNIFLARARQTCGSEFTKTRHFK